MDHKPQERAICQKVRLQAQTNVTDRVEVPGVQDVFDYPWAREVAFYKASRGFDVLNNCIEDELLIKIYEELEDQEPGYE